MNIQKLVIIGYVVCNTLFIFSSDMELDDPVTPSTEVPLSTQFDHARLTSPQAALQYAQELWTTYEKDNFTEDEQKALLAHAQAIADLTVQQTFRSTARCNELMKNPILSNSGKIVAGISLDERSIIRFSLDSGMGDKIELEENQDAIQHIDFGADDTLYATTTHELMVFNNFSTLTQKIEYGVRRCEHTITALAAHKSYPIVAVAHKPKDKNIYSGVSYYDSSSITPQTLPSFNSSHFSRISALKWHPLAIEIAIKTKDSLTLYHAYKKTTHTFNNISPTTNFDFNEDGTQLWLSSKKQFLAIINTQLYRQHKTEKMVKASGTVRNLCANYFVVQLENEAHPSLVASCIVHKFGVAPTVKTILPLIDECYQRSALTTHPTTRTLLAYRTHQKGEEFTTTYFPTLFGTHLDPQKIKHHNLACMAALALAKNHDDLKLLLSSGYKEIVEDAAQKESSFKSVIDGIKKVVEKS